MHAASLREEMSRITDKEVDRFREQYAMDCYEEFFVRMLFEPNGTYVCVNRLERNGKFMVCLCDYAFMILEKQKVKRY